MVVMFISYRKRIDDVEDDFDELDEDDEDDNDEDSGWREALQHFVKKGKGKKSKKPGRKPRWCPKALDDFIDIVVTNNNYKMKLIFSNTKNQRNSPIYAKILEKLKARASARGDDLTLTVAQLRTKFKKCVSWCKQAALTQKTATGIKRFQEDHGFGKWFSTLYEVVKTRDSCQPDQALEPSTSNSDKSFDGTDDSRESGAELFVPKKNVRKRQSAKEKLDSTTFEVMEMVKEAVRNDPTKDLIAFMREEMEKSREHEMKLFHLMFSHRANAGYDHSLQGMTSSHNMAYGETGFYPTWNGGLGPNQMNQSRMPEGSYGSPFPYDSGKYTPL